MDCTFSLTATTPMLPIASPISFNSIHHSYFSGLSYAAIQPFKMPFVYSSLSCAGHSRYLVTSGSDAQLRYIGSASESVNFLKTRRLVSIVFVPKCFTAVLLFHSYDVCLQNSILHSKYFGFTALICLNHAGTASSHGRCPHRLISWSDALNRFQVHHVAACHV